MSFQLEVPQDYTSNPQAMPRPYVVFEMRSTEVRTHEGNVAYSDEVWAKVVAPGGKDVLEKPAADWIAGLTQHAQAGRIPAFWPGEYKKALEAFIAGEELPVHGTPIKSWPPLTPAQRKSILAANVLTVEDLAAANDEMKIRIGMGANNLVILAQNWMKNAQDSGALASRLEQALAANEELTRQVAELTTLVKADKQSLKVV